MEVVRGTLITKPINLNELPRHGGTEFKMVYMPSGGLQNLYWAQRVGNSALLFAFPARVEWGLENKLEELKDIYFQEKESNQQGEHKIYRVAEDQWPTVVDTNRVDTEVEVKAVIETLPNKSRKVARLASDQIVSWDDFYARLMGGFPSVQAAKEAIERMGYKVVPKKGYKERHPGKGHERKAYAAA